MKIGLMIIPLFIGLKASALINNSTTEKKHYSHAGNVADPIDTVQNILALQNYAGSAKMLLVTDSVSGGLFYKTAVGTIDNGTVFSGVDGYWKRQYQKGIVHVGWFGGKTNVQIQNAINVADTGGIIYLQSESRYIVYASIFPKSGQRIVGMYDTLQRCNEVKAVLQTPIAIGTAPHTFDVNDASNFTVGMLVNFYSANNLSGSPAVHKITNINGNTITTDNGLSYSQAFAVGDTVITEFAMISNPFGGGTVIKNVGIENIVFDGNKANNTSHIYWAFNAAAAIYCDNLKVSECYFINSKSDGLIMGGENPIVTHCQFLNGNSNGVHLSGTYNPVICNNYFYNNNLNIATGHNEGHITFSDSIFQANIYGNYFRKTSQSGVGRIGGSLNGGSCNVSIHDNVFDSCSFASLNVGSGSVVSPDIYNINISNNRIYNCGRLGITGAAGNLDRSKGPGRINITGNLFINSPVALTRSNSINFSDNIFYKYDSSVLSQAAFMFMIDNENISITGNQFVGNALYALQCDNSATTTGTYQDKGYQISGNNFINQSFRSIAFASKSSGTFENIKISNNNFKNSICNNAVVNIGSGIEFSFNTMNITSTNSNCAVACQFMKTSSLDSVKSVVIKNNYIKIKKGYAIRTGYGSGVAITDNQYATSDLAISSPVQDNATATFFAYNNIIDSANTGIGMAKPLAKWHTAGTVRIDLGEDAKYDTNYRDSSTGNLVRLPAGNYGQVYMAGPGGKPQWAFPSANTINFAVQTVTGNTTLNSSNYTTIVNNTGTATIFLPTAVGADGRIYVIKKVSPALNNVIIDASNAELIDGTLSQTLTQQYSSVMLQSNGHDWVILCAVGGGMSL